MTEPTKSELPMYRRLRLKLTLWYLLLSGIVCLTLVFVGTWLCYSVITDSINETMEELIGSCLPNVDVQKDQVRFLVAQVPVQNEWARMSSTVQLYDAAGKLVYELGPHGLAKAVIDQDYVEAKVDGRNLRCTSDPVKYQGKTVGYLQVEMPTTIRDEATKHFEMVMICITPFLMLTLAWFGYIFSGKAARPVENAFSLLRQFMADAGHELRTPIHAVQLIAENVAAETKDKQLVEDMETISRSTDRMGRLVDDMMTLTKIEVQQVHFKNEDVQLDELVRGAIAEFKPAFAEKEITLKNGAMVPAVVRGDSDALHRVIANLLQNAMRYTDAGGEVTLSMSSAGNQVTLSVADTGIGIPTESLPHIFDRFYRVDKSRARVAGGSGLGLSIVKAICEQHKGNITVQSEEGKGTTFVVTLPCSQVLVGESANA